MQSLQCEHATSFLVTPSSSESSSTVFKHIRCQDRGRFRCLCFCHDRLGRVLRPNVYLSLLRFLGRRGVPSFPVLLTSL